MAKESCNEGKCLNEGEEEEEDTELRAEENRAVKSDHYPTLVNHYSYRDLGHGMVS